MAFLYILLFIFGILYIAAPVLIYFVLKQNENPDLNLFDPYQEPMPRLDWEYFCSTYSGLQKSGFELSAYVRGNMMGNVIYMMLLYNQSERDCVMVSTSANQAVQLRYVEFSTDYENDMAINTNNSTIKAIFVKNPKKFVYQFRDVSDTYLLYEIHKAILRRTQLPYSKIFYPPESHFEEVKKCVKKSMEYQRSKGIFKFNESSRTYSPTIIGAYIMTWQLLFPLKQIFARVYKYKMNKLLKSILKELELGGITGMDRTY